jgi:phosphoribosylanthranilate isomerase
MHGTKTPRIKICCIQNKGEAFMAINMGASALGLVSNMPSGPGPIPDKKIAAIAAVMPPFC